MIEKHFPSPVEGMEIEVKHHLTMMIAIVSKQNITG